ncbi:MAG: hypothetical protein ABI680_08760, partial [Chthoniobacteraceae bacterium]
GKGRYQVIAAAASAGSEERPEQAVGGFAVPYSPEYLKFRSDPILLKQIAERTGGRVLNSSDVELFHPPRTVRESSRPVFDWFLLALCLFIPFDVGLRRIQLDWNVIFGWFRSSPAEASTETMGALLQRKAHIKETLEVPRPERPPPLAPPAFRQPPAASSAPLPPSPTPESPTSEDGSQSTTERLLARKRRRQEDQE